MLTDGLFVHLIDYRSTRYVSHDEQLILRRKVDHSNVIVKVLCLSDRASFPSAIYTIGNELNEACWQNNILSGWLCYFDFEMTYFFGSFFLIGMLSNAECRRVLD